MMRERKGEKNVPSRMFFSSDLLSWGLDNFMLRNVIYCATLSREFLCFIAETGIFGTRQQRVASLLSRGHISRVVASEIRFPRRKASLVNRPVDPNFRDEYVSPRAIFNKSIATYQGDVVHSFSRALMPDGSAAPIFLNVPIMFNYDPSRSPCTKSSLIQLDAPCHSLCRRHRNVTG